MKRKSRVAVGAAAETARAKIVNPDSMSNKQYNCAD